MSCRFAQKVACPHAVIGAGGSLVAFVSGTRVTLKDFATLKEIAVFACIDRIDDAVFSPDGTLVMCAIKSRSVIQIFSVEDITWKARIDEACVGFKSAVFCPDSRHILIESDFGIHISIWSLLDSTSTLIMHQKNVPHSSGSKLQIYSFSNDKKYLAIIHKVDLVDQIGVYDTVSWNRVSQLRCVSQDCISVDFSPLTSSHLITCDSPFVYIVTIYNISGEVLSTIKPYINALGFRNIAFHSIPLTATQAILSHRDGDLSSLAIASRTHSSSSIDGLQVFDFASSMNSNKNPVSNASFFALGSFDDKVRLVSLNSWQVVFVFHLVHPKDMEIAITSVLADKSQTYTTASSISMYGESDSVTSAMNKKEKEGSSVVTADFKDLLLVEVFENDEDNKKVKSNLDAEKPTQHQHIALKALPKSSASTAASAGAAKPLVGSTGVPACGCSWSSICPRGVYLAARSDSHPRCLWIFNAVTAKLVTVIVQLEVIVQACWSNSTDCSILAFIGALSHKIYFWSDSFSFDPEKYVSESRIKLMASYNDNSEDENAAFTRSAPPILSAYLNKTQLSSISEIKWNHSSPMTKVNAKSTSSKVGGGSVGSADGIVMQSIHELMLSGRDGSAVMDVEFEHS